MKRNGFKIFTLLLSGSLLLSGCNSQIITLPRGEQGAPGEKGDKGDQGDKGNPGENGVSIISIQLISSKDNVDTYEILYSNGSKSTFTVTNGVDGQSIKGDKGDDGHTPIIEVGDNGNWFVDGVDTGVVARGPKGEQGYTGEKGEKGDKGDNGLNGTNGYSVLTGHGEPTSELGTNGDSYIDLDSFTLYVKDNGQWLQSGNIKGDQGISITSSEIDDNGDLIITLSNGETINAGHVKNMDTCEVKFFCDDLLVDTQFIKNGDKISLPNLQDFTVKHWYIDKDFEYEWLWYGCVVTEDMSLYGDFTPITKSLSFNKEADITVDEYGYGNAFSNEKEICVSKAEQTSNFLTTLEGRGIIFNKSEIGYIEEVTINIDNDGFSSGKIYYGNNPLSFEHNQDLVSGNNTINLANAEYFTIQNTGSNPMNIRSLDIDYSIKTKFVDDSIPTVVINTKNSQSVTSRTEYVDCDVSTIGADKDVSALKAQIKIRGNSTSQCPKKPYRIKLSKKNSLFGYEKAKNWVLLADYMDGSNMHSYTALKFAKMLRGKDSFGVDPLHVNVVLNGENIGIYEFAEHIDAKEGRLNIEQDKLWEKEFDDINFYIERDLSTAQDSTEIEGTTYFRVPLNDYSPSQYVFALKYPEKEDFEEELESGEIDTHEEEFNSFFNSLKDYMTEICEKFVDYSHNASYFSSISESVDIDSLVEYSITDQLFKENDHSQKSFKMYRADGGLLKFGPNWDYDSCSYGLPYQGTYVLNPFEVGMNVFENLYFGEGWGYMLFNDMANGRPLFKEYWDDITTESLEKFVDNQFAELNLISSDSIYDCERWMHNQYYCLFDNVLYYFTYLTNQTTFLKSFYS